MDVKRRLIYGLAENGHLYKYHIDKDWTEDLGRVDEWDVCRTIFIDDAGNVYGSYPPGKIWKYDPVKDRTFDFEHIRLPLINQSRTMANPMLDRKAQWRIVEWDPVDRAAYGIIGGSNLLFKYNPNDGPEGVVTPLVSMAAPGVRNGDPMNLPVAIARHGSLAEGAQGLLHHGHGRRLRLRRPSPRTSSWRAVVSSSRYDSTTRPAAAMTWAVLRSTDGRTASGMGGAKVDKDGRLWFVGAFSEPDPKFQVTGRRPYSMGLGCYDPSRK